MTQQCYKIRNSPAMLYDKVYVSNGPRLGKSQQRKKLRYTLAMFYDWEQLSNVTRQCIRRQCFKIGKISAA